MIKIICQLAVEDIKEPSELRNVKITDIEGSADAPVDIQDFVQRLCQVCKSFACVFTPGIEYPLALSCQAQPGAAYVVSQNHDEVRFPHREDLKAKRQCISHVASLCSAQTTLLRVSNARPMEALDMLERNLPRDPMARKEWTVCAHVAAVMGSCPRSLASFKSGLRHWLRYIEIMYGRDSLEASAFPPHLDDVLAWSNTFRLALCFNFGS